MKKLVFFIILILLFTGSWWWWNNGISPVDPTDSTYMTFTVNKGDGVRQVADNLKKKKLIKDPFVFTLQIKQLGMDEKIQAGEFRLSPSMNAVDIAKKLQTATNDIQITIPEGKRAEEIADILSESFPNYDETWRSQLIQKEGYLFPDTYSFSPDADIDQIITVMTDTFTTKYNALTGIRKNDLSEKEIIIIASLVEREAKHDEDRPIVASVILNRYDQEMKLDIDATIQYALGFDNQSKRWWKPALTYDDLEIDSPFNTYRKVGLPPTPIANPGVKAIEAVMNPATTEYLFYITDSNGINHYARTNDEHEANKDKYGL